jgi:hypothetical protein
MDTSAHAVLAVCNAACASDTVDLREIAVGCRTVLSGFRALVKGYKALRMLKGG